MKNVGGNYCNSQDKKIAIKNIFAFTLIELLVTIAIIGIISTLVTVGLVSSRAKARDAKRQHDLAQIGQALVLYYNDHGNWMYQGSGCGSSGNGSGWFNYVGGSYPKSMAQCLIDEGYTKSEIIDPTGSRTCSIASNYAYMKYVCVNGTQAYIYAKLETVVQSATATDGTCCSTCDTNYGMNYYLLVQ